MAVHDWTRVLPGTFHDFHGRWITHLSETLNAGLLPAGYYALSEQPADRLLTLAAYEAKPAPTAYVEPIRVGAALPDMPLFIQPGWYINVPLETATPDGGADAVRLPPPSPRGTDAEWRRAGANGLRGQA